MNKPRILLYDIETTPNLGYTWGKWEQNVIGFKKEWELLSVAYRWLGTRGKPFCITRQGEPTDKNVVKHLHSLFRRADMLIAHNGDSFDQKKVKARMLFHGLPPPKILSSVDTKKIAKTHFAFNGNGLDDLCQHLGLGKKLGPPRFDLWLGCMANDAKAWAKMIKYNKHDVVLLERLYKRFLPWITTHPSVARLANPYTGLGCPNCGSNRIQKRGFRATRVHVQQQIVCMACGAWQLRALGKAAK